jgi:pimeloyl-ACP methyl ester carboxylesterase
MDVGVEALRAAPSGIEQLGIEEIVDHYEDIIGKLDQPPIIMGHSFGGAFTQVLLDRGYGAAGVGIDAAAVKGVARLASTNTMTEEDSRAVYDTLRGPRPGSRAVPGAFANFNPHAPTRVDFHNDHRAPLLLIAGGTDHTVPAVVDRSTADHYKSKAITEYKEFPGRSHFTLGQDGWEEVADYALDWAVEHARGRDVTPA